MTRLLRALGALSLLTAIVLAGPVSRAGAAPPAPSLPGATVVEYPIPTANSYPGGIAAGTGSTLWFTEQDGNHIARITTGGTITEFALPANSQPNSIAYDGSGHEWFTAYIGNRVGRITSTGAVTVWNLPTAFSHPQGITLGADGRMWFAESDANQIGTIDATGVLHEYAIPTANSHPVGITSGPDANLWFAEDGANQIGRVSPSGTFAEFPLPTSNAAPSGIARGPDGNLWFTEWAAGKIGCITPGGAVAEFALPNPSAQPEGIVTGPDGNLWFTENATGRVARISPLGVVQEYTLPTPASHPRGITAGPDAAIWFTEEQANQIGRLTIPSNPPPTPTVPAPTATPTPCTTTFADVPPSNPFYPYVQYMACHGIISGYADGTFRPYADATRAQFSKMVALASRWVVLLPPTPDFADVPTSSPFYAYVEKAYIMGVISGYACGGPGEPCDDQQRPYFRPNAGVTRAQIAKILVLAEHFPTDTSGGPHFVDVPPAHPFYDPVETAYHHGLMSGYACGAAGEPCPGLYLRPYGSATRGQISKMIYEAIGAP